MQQSKITEEPKRTNSRISIQPGAIFSQWTVIGENPHKRHGKVLCRCSCGTERIVFVQNLLSGRSTSCGCASVESRDAVKPGAVFGKWTVLGENPHTRHGMALCRCTCGVEKMVFVSNLLLGLSKSCGCTPLFVPGMMQGRLYVIGHPWLDSMGRKRVKCYCDCGRTYFPRTDDLYYSRIRSCRCFHFRSEYRLRMKETAVASLPLVRGMALGPWGILGLREPITLSFSIASLKREFVTSVFLGVTIWI